MGFTILKLLKLPTNKFFDGFYKDESGQSTTEYILILLVVVTIALKFKGQFTQILSGMLDKLGGKLNDATQVD
jgi:Flp pilus assembly pilin Flp